MRWLDALRRWIVVAVVFGATVLSAGVASATLGASAPECTVRGRTLAEWMRTYFEHYIAGDLPVTIRGVTLMPLPAGVQVSGRGTSEDPALLVGSIDVTLRRGAWFAMPIAAWLGETYDPATGLPPDTPLSPSLFTTSDVLVTLDGRPIIDSERDDLSRYYFGPLYFDPPLLYDEPMESGSIGAIFVQGLGFLHPPLRRGRHTLRLQSELIANVPDYYGEGMDLDVGIRYDNTWHITVVP